MNNKQNTEKKPIYKRKWFIAIVSSDIAYMWNS